MNTFRFFCNIQNLNSVIVWVGIYVYDWCEVYFCHNSSVTDWTVHNQAENNYIKNKYLSIAMIDVKSIANTTVVKWIEQFINQGKNNHIKNQKQIFEYVTIILKTNI
jgi:hypothetical protein